MTAQKPRGNWIQVGGVNSGIVREFYSGFQGQIRTIVIDPINLIEDEELIYEYRKNTNLPFVKVYDHWKLDKKSTQSKQIEGQTMIVITERISHRLVDAPQLSFPQSLYILDRALLGFEESFSKCGPMRINDRMIGFSNEGYCKVWINQNFGNNHPSNPRRTMVSTVSNPKMILFQNTQETVNADQSQMVQQIIDIVEGYCEEGRFPEPFYSKIHNQQISFSQARRIISDLIFKNNFLISQRVDLYTNIVQCRRRYPIKKQENVINIGGKYTKAKVSRLQQNTTFYTSISHQGKNILNSQRTRKINNQERSRGKSINTIKNMKCCFP